MSQAVHSTSAAGEAVSRLFIRVMFRHVQGWKRVVPSRARAFVEVGEDGSRLEGAFVRTDARNPRGVVMLCHPFLKYGMHYFFENRIDAELAAHGYHVAMFNFKGFGASTIGGHAFADDVNSIARRVAREFPELPIHLLGCSFGGYHLSHALARDSRLFASAVLDSVPLTVRSYFTRGLLRHAMRWISGSRLAVPTGTCSIDQSLRHVRGLPLAYLYGSDDRYIPKESVDALVDCVEGMQVIAFDGCKHLEGHKKSRGTYFAQILDFYAQVESGACATAG